MLGTIAESCPSAPGCQATISWHGPRDTPNFRRRTQNLRLQAGGVPWLAAPSATKTGGTGKPSERHFRGGDPWRVPRRKKKKWKTQCCCATFALEKRVHSSVLEQEATPSEVPRVGESVPGWAEPEPQLLGQIGIQRYQM